MRLGDLASPECPIVPFPGASRGVGTNGARPRLGAAANTRTRLARHPAGDHGAPARGTRICGRHQLRCFDGDWAQDGVRLRRRRRRPGFLTNKEEAIMTAPTPYRSDGQGQALAPATARQLEVGEKFTIDVIARRHWNNTGLHVTAGQRYQLAARGTWVDFYIP